MTDEKYVVGGPQVNDQERELLIVTMEECGEVVELCADLSHQCARIIYDCSKMMRFGKMDQHPREPEKGPQVERLATELGQMLAMIDQLVECDLIPLQTVDQARQEKHRKLKKYLQHSRGFDHVRNSLCRGDGVDE